MAREHQLASTDAPVRAISGLVLEKSINELRRAIRAAATVGDTERADELRAQLRRTERAWDILIDANDPPVTSVITERANVPLSHGSMLPAREHAHRALMLLNTPAAPKLIVDVHEAFFPGELAVAKLSSLRRDEERSYRTGPGARPYYLCPALTYDLLSPARALITISTWTLEQRIIGRCHRAWTSSPARSASLRRSGLPPRPRTPDPARWRCGFCGVSP